MNLVDDITHIPEPQLSKLFRLSMWWRIIYGVLRLLLGIALLKVIGKEFSDLMYTLMSHELSGRAGDFVLEHLYMLFEKHSLKVTYFVALYFIFWGLVEIVLSLCLLKKIRAAFPAAISLIVLFIVYSVFRYLHTHSLVLLSVIVIDLVILGIIYQEYRSLKTNPKS